MGRTEEVSVYQFVSLVGVDDVSGGPVPETTDVIHRVVAHLMPLAHYSLEEFGVLSYIVAHHEERSLCPVFLECLKDERCGFGYRTVVEGQIYCLLVLVHSPYRFRIKPSKPLGRLFYEHL